jgi:alkaline phosphatase D
MVGLFRNGFVSITTLPKILVLSCVAFAVLTACASSSREVPSPDSSFPKTTGFKDSLLPEGLGVGDVTSWSAVLWLRTDGPKAVRVLWAPLDDWRKMGAMASVRSVVSETQTLVTGPETDFTLSVPLEHLTPATRYRYRVLVDSIDRAPGLAPGTPAATGEVTTLPDPAQSVPLTFAWSGDLGGQDRCRQGEAGYPIFDVIAAQHPDFFIFLGDTIYADGICSAPPNEPGAGFVAMNLPEYRLRHRYQRGAPALRRLLSSVPVYVIWDDHEVKDNFAGPYEPQMAAGRQALREYWPIATQAGDTDRLYRSVRYGANLELFILDTRQYRSKNSDPDGPAKTMLGMAQLSWLLDGLRTSTATWKAVVTSVPLSIPKGGGAAAPGYDGWSGGPPVGSDGTGFERERQVIVDRILGGQIKNVVFLAGDVHYVQANAYDPDGDGRVDFYEFVSGPLSARFGRMTPPNPGLHPTVLLNDGGYSNFGLVRVTAESFEVAFVDDTGKTRFSHLVQAQ